MIIQEQQGFRKEDQKGKNKNKDSVVYESESLGEL